MDGLDIMALNITKGQPMGGSHWMGVTLCKVEASPGVKQKAKPWGPRGPGYGVTRLQGLWPRGLGWLGAESVWRGGDNSLEWAVGWRQGVLSKDGGSLGYPSVMPPSAPGGACCPQRQAHLLASPPRLP